MTETKFGMPPNVIVGWWYGRIVIDDEYAVLLRFPPQHRWHPNRWCVCNVGNGPSWDKTLIDGRWQPADGERADSYWSWLGAWLAYRRVGRPEFG